MGKQNNNFEYFKPQSDRDGLFVPSDSESEDCKDSDSKAMFTLPKRKFVRKKMLRRKDTFLCKSVCDAVVPFIIAAFIIGTLVSIGYIILGVNGMRNEIELLKIQLFKVKSDEQSDLLHSKNIQTSVSQKLASLAKDEKEIAELKVKVKHLILQVKKLNSTISEVKSQKDSSAAPPNINKDLALLKKGMADTGVDIKKLSDENEATRKTVTLLSKLVRSLKEDVSKLKDASSSVDNDSAEKEPVDTLPPLVATASPADKAQESKRSLKKLSALMKKLVDGYGELFSNKTKKLKLELLHLKKDVIAFNNTAKIKFIALESTVKMLQNFTSVQGAELHNVVARLSGKSFDVENKTSDGKILNIVKGMLVGLKTQHSIIANLTRRVAGIEKLASVDRAQKQEDSVNSVVNGEGITHTTEKFWTEAPKESLKTTEKFTVESTSRSDAPFTTSPPMEVTSSKEIEAKSSPLSGIKSTTAPSLKSTEAEVASTTSLPSTSQAENATMETKPQNESKLDMKNVPIMTTGEPVSQKSMNATRQNETLTGKTGLHKSQQKTNKTQLEQLVDAANNVDLTANLTTSTRKPKADISNVKATTKSVDGLEVLDGGKRSFDSTTNMAGDRSQRQHKFSTPSDPDMDPDDNPFGGDFSPSEEWDQEHQSDSMNLNEGLSNGRSKHDTSNPSDGFDTLDQLDDSV